MYTIISKFWPKQWCSFLTEMQGIWIKKNIHLTSSNLWNCKRPNFWRFYLQPYCSVLNGKNTSCIQNVIKAHMTCSLHLFLTANTRAQKQFIKLLFKAKHFLTSVIFYIHLYPLTFCWTSPYNIKRALNALTSHGPCKLKSLPLFSQNYVKTKARHFLGLWQGSRDHSLFFLLHYMGL